ncbi:hypothetical protein [uncultured Brevundimonas sp.]|uniref:hypothetical protein n=1 Tax=uncultured Brevundimonas sp. TaxID=213418 RepID=UPI0025EFCEBE|nr:hypothetical protein [uncultured Brevundimonas sp.]
MATLWAAVITSIPACLAILFAYRVGKNQVAIAKAAHELESERVRAELYERRAEVYGAARKYVNTILLVGRIPGFGNAYDVSIHQNFMEALGASEFLFDDNVATIMDRISQTALRFHTLEQVSKSALADPDGYGPETMEKLHNQLMELKEAVRPYLTINGRGEVPQGSHV